MSDPAAMTKSTYLNLATLATLAVVILLLAACATPPQQPGATMERIRDELGQAATERKLNNEGIVQALMPPLQIEMPKAVEHAELRFDLSVVNAPVAQVFMA
ncbi:MAG: hypothetical protein AAB319_00495, partial [Pseudomonadota bacterium]